MPATLTRSPVPKRASGHTLPLSLGFLLTLALSTPFWDMAHPLWEVDDARYAEVPREMAESGDWLTPRLNYMDYVEKPPLIYWLGALSCRVLGSSEGATRLPLALLSLLGLLGVFRLGKRLDDPKRGAYGAVILAGSALYFALGRILTPDTALSVFLLWAMGSMLLCLLGSASRANAWIAWACLAAAFFSKGFIALLLPGLWLLGALLLCPELRPGLGALLHKPAIAFFLAATGGWLALMEATHPGFLRFFVIEQHWLRYVTPLYDRPGPWYYFLASDMLGSLPWSPLVAAAVLLPLLNWRRAETAEKALALWCLGLLVFFSLSHSKLMTYILPALPQQALLGAGLLRRLDAKRGPSLAVRWLSASLAALLLGALCLTPWQFHRLGLPFPLSPAVLSAALFGLLCLGACQIRLAWGRMGGEGLRTLRLVTFLSLASYAAALGGLRTLTPYLSCKELALSLAAKLRPADRLIAYDKYLHGLSFYTGRPVDLVNFTGEFHYAKRLARFRPRFGDDDTLRKLPKTGSAGRIFAVLPRKELRYFISLVGLDRIRETEPHGNWMVVEL